MKLSLKAVNGKLRLLAQRVGQGLKFVLDCCCETQGEPDLHLFYECCDPVPRFAITNQAYNALTSRCPQVDPPQFMLVKFRGAEDNICYREGDLGNGRISREEAVRLGYTIYETPATFDCSRGDGTRDNRCGWSGCRQCYPNQCCLTQLYDKECSLSLLIPNSVPKKNVCCNYGRVLRRRASYSQTIQHFRRTFLNQGVSDSFCAAGCYAPLNRDREYEQLVYNIEDEFTKCFDNGDPVGSDGSWLQRNLRNDRYYRVERIRTVYGFDGDPNLPTCLSSRDEVLSDLTINDNNVPNNNTIFPFFWPNRLQRISSQPLPPRDNCFGFWFLPFYPAILDTPNTYFPFGEAQIQCDDVYGHVYECIIAYGTYRLKIITDRYTHSASCNQGQYSLAYAVEVYSHRPQGWPENEPLCPPENTLLERFRIDVSCTYFIETLSRTNCDPQTCNGYAKTGNMTPVPFPLLPQPIQGALNLL